MRKLVVLGLLLAASTGCGRGWFPHLFRGAPCNGLCSSAAPTPHIAQRLRSCSAGYAGYGEDGVVVGSGMEIGGYENVIGSGTAIGNPGMSGIPSGSYIAPPPTQLALKAIHKSPPVRPIKLFAHVTIACSNGSMTDDWEMGGWDAMANRNYRGIATV